MLIKQYPELEDGEKILGKASNGLKMVSVCLIGEFLPSKGCCGAGVSFNLTVNSFIFGSYGHRALSVLG